jgi:hypothetical protein
MPLYARQLYTCQQRFIIVGAEKHKTQWRSTFLDAYKGIVWHFVSKWKDMQLFRFHKLNAALNLENSEGPQRIEFLYRVFERKE